MYTGNLFKQTIFRTIKTASSTNQTNLCNNIRVPSVKINTTALHSMTNDIKSLQQSNRSPPSENHKTYIPSLNSDDESLETAIPYIRVWKKKKKKAKERNEIFKPNFI